MISKQNLLRASAAHFFLISIGLILIFALLRWDPDIATSALEKKVVFVYLALALILATANIFFKRYGYLIIFVNTAHFILIGFLTFIQTCYFISPSSIPLSAINIEPFLIPHFVENRRSLEFLPESPWIKFKPNSIAWSTDVGREKEFQHIWKTDSLGFKNKFSLEDVSSLWAVTIGTSQAEGMGLPVENTYSSILTRGGYPTYSLGLQGYAPQQIAGSLSLFRAHSEITPKYVLWGYTPGHEGATTVFRNPKEVVSQKSFSGGVEVIKSRELSDSPNNPLATDKPRYKYFLALNTFLDMLKSWGRDSLPADADSGDIFDWYDKHFPGFYRFDPNSDVAKWTFESILKAKAIAEEMKSELVVVFFTTREFLYFKDTKWDRPILDNEVLLKNSLATFCQQNGIRMVDTYPGLRKYIENLAPPIKHQQLPYFKDGHPNQVGAKIISDVILSNLK